MTESSKGWRHLLKRPSRRWHLWKVSCEVNQSTNHSKINQSINQIYYDYINDYDYILDGQPINSISTSYSEGSRRFLFWQGFWHVWSCSDLLKVFCMVGLFTSPPTNWRLFRVKFQQVNWPWNSKSCVICAPLGWVLVGAIGRRVSQVLITISVDCRLTCR